MSVVPVQADVLLLAAGFGKRLGRVTESLPKPLVRVRGRSLIERHLEDLSRAGFSRVIINLHYLGDMIREHLGDGSRWGLEIVYSPEDPILDTGGAIKNVQHLLRESVLITVNSDTLIGNDFSYEALIAAHLAAPHLPLATLVLRRDPRATSFGEVGIDNENRISYFIDTDVPGTTTAQRGLLYTGIQAINPILLEKMPPAGTAFSITRDTYYAVLKEQQGALQGYLYGGYWSDVGTPERLLAAENDDSIELER